MKPIVAGALILMLVGACATIPRFAVQGTFGGRPIDTTVDSPAAAALVEGRAMPPAFEDFLAEPGLPDTVRLKTLAAATSPDAATLALLAKIDRAAPGAALRARYAAFRARLSAGGRSQWPVLAACLSGAGLPEVHFVPGWFYRRNPSTGADFAAQRRVLNALGFTHRLIEIDEDGAVEVNAQAIAAHLRRARAGASGIVLVSTSKGGPETAHALGRLMSADEATAVAAWINIGGILGGSPLADTATTWPISWLARLALSWDGIDARASLPSLTSAAAARRLAVERMPGHLRIVNYVGLPVSGQITAEALDGYRRLRRFGPNDGLTPVAEQWRHGGDVIAAPGLDHFYRDPEIDTATAALAFTVFEALGHDRPATCVRP
ncbi:MAG: hypothetical protein SFV21_18255 [Rhodospirillaceae bacterium]|nr:hypothetical protein [Rhodospirillaceae bacterium]